MLSMQKYYCNVCNTQFDAKGYWNHIKRKTACVSSKEIIDKLQSKDSRINYFKVKTKKHLEQLELKENKNQKLQEQIDYLKGLLEHSNEKVQTKLIEMEDKIEIGNAQRGNFFTAKNQFFIDKLNKEENNNLMHIDYSKPSEERLDHISMDMMMTILNQKTFDETVCKLFQAIYFHPAAPQNWLWCVNDKDSKYGALEYDHETGGLVRTTAEKIINKSFENVMFRVADLLDELKQNRNLNQSQAVNYNRLGN